MAILNSLLLAAHLIGLALIVSAALALWRGGDLLARGEGGPGLARLGRLSVMLGNLGLLLNWVSGPILVFTKYNGFGGLGPWFWLKIAFVIGLSAALGIAAASFRRATTTLPTAAAKASGVGGIAVLLGLGVIFAAAFAFG